MLIHSYISFLQTFFFIPLFSALTLISLTLINCPDTHTFSDKHATLSSSSQLKRYSAFLAAVKAQTAQQRAACQHRLSMFLSPSTIRQNLSLTATQAAIRLSMFLSPSTIRPSLYLTATQTAIRLSMLLSPSTIRPSLSLTATQAAIRIVQSDDYSSESSELKYTIITSNDEPDQQQNVNSMWPDGAG
jgi:hypothetical protein